MLAEVVVLGLAVVVVRAIVRGLLRSSPAKAEPSLAEPTPTSDPAETAAVEAQPSGGAYRAPGVILEPAAEPPEEEVPEPAPEPTAPAPITARVVGKVRLIDRSVRVSPPPAFADRKLMAAFVLVEETDEVVTSYGAKGFVAGRPKLRREPRTSRSLPVRDGVMFFLLTPEGQVTIDARRGFAHEDLDLVDESVTPLGRLSPAELDRTLDERERDSLARRERSLLEVLSDEKRNDDSGPVSFSHVLRKRRYALVVENGVRLDVSGTKSPPDGTSLFPYPTLGPPGLVLRPARR